MRFKVYLIKPNLIAKEMPSVATGKPSTSRAPAENDDAATWIDNFLGSDGGPSSATKQMIIGGVSGW